jgi:CBS domain containing-hemolysin-like protein
VYTGLMLALALFLVLLNGFFVAAEFAFVKVRRTRLEVLAYDGNSLARIALFGVDNLDAYLSVCQLGITLASLGLGWIGEPAVAVLVHPFLELFSISNPALLSSISITIGFTVITFMHVILGELMPKSISIQRAEATVLLLAVPLKMFYYLSLPIVGIMNGISNFLLRRIGMHSVGETEESHSREELRMLIMNSGKEGLMSPSEERMLGNIFSFYKKSAKDVMIHRTDVMILNLHEGTRVAREKARDSGHTRFPVYDADEDALVGFLHAKDLLYLDDASDLRSILRTALFVQETTHLDGILRLMQEQRVQICVVLDEYGAWQGITTMEDLMETIVGDIQDEFDNEAPDVVPQPDGSLLVSAELSLEELARHTDISCDDHDIDLYKILAAHILDQLGRIPSVGDQVVVCNKMFTVAAMDRRRIRRIRVSSPQAIAK